MVLWSIIFPVDVVKSRLAVSGASTPLLAMLVSIQKVGEDSIVVSLFVDILDELTNTVSDGKIQISILILRRGPCLLPTPL